MATPWTLEKELCGLAGAATAAIDFSGAAGEISAGDAVERERKIVLYWPRAQ